MTSTEPRGLELADEIMTLIGRHPRDVAVDALSQVVGLFCTIRSDKECRASLADFVAAAERKQAELGNIFAGKAA